MKWGSRDWFLNKFETQGVVQPSAYFAYRKNGYQRYRHKQLANYLREGTGRKLRGRFLDIGCSTGDLTMYLKEKHDFEHALGIDFVEPAIELARFRYPDTEFEVGVLPGLRFSSEVFDLVVASEVLYYLDDEGQHKAVTEIARVLKQNGLFLFSSVLGEVYFTVASARKLLSNTFEIEYVWYDYNRLYHLLVGPARVVNNLYYTLYEGSEGASRKVRDLAERYRDFFNFLPISALVRGACMITRPLLRSEALPKSLGRVSKRYIPGQTRTNVTILAKKK